MTGYLKYHKNPVTARPVISHRNAPMSNSSKWLAGQLASCVGLISQAHIRNTRDFHNRVKRSKAKGRLLSLDVKSLFTNIPLDEVIDIIRSHSIGPDPLYRNFPIDPEIFCNLLKVTTSFNQFNFMGEYYRQISGVPMGSSLSPILANIFMEFFETQLIEDIPEDLRPELWLRFVDDVFCCYRDMDKFEEFLLLLNSIRPTIIFTVELSMTNTSDIGPQDLPIGVTERIPFLELNVMRLHNGNFTFSIYRKPCHAGNYLHAFSYQPLFQKQAVIRGLYLRAFRYCDKQYLKEEELRIQQDFTILGYTASFIESCRTSAYKGHTNEVKMEHLLSLQELPFVVKTITPRKKPEYIARFVPPFHPYLLRYIRPLAEMGIELCFTSNSTIRQQLRRRSPSCRIPIGQVYVLNCSCCSHVYVGQTGRPIEERMREHFLGNQKVLGAVKRHNSLPGHHMDLYNPTSVFNSDCRNTRETVEAALIHVAPTVQGNTSTKCTANDELVAPIICRSTRFNWKNLSDCIPNLPESAVTKHQRKLFGSQRIRRPPRHLRSDHIGTPIGHSTRSRTEERSAGRLPQLDFSST